MASFTVEQIIEETGWVEPGRGVPSDDYKRNMQRALDFFQRVVPGHVLQEPDDGGPWNLRIRGQKIRLLNWMQGIDFKKPVNPHRIVHCGESLIAFKEPSMPRGQVRGNWYTSPGTKQGSLAIHSSTNQQHSFAARHQFTCMESTVSDTYVGWLADRPAEYRHGGGQQLFIWAAHKVLAAG